MLSMLSPSWAARSWEWAHRVRHVGTAQGLGVPHAAAPCAALMGGVALQIRAVAKCTLGPFLLVLLLWAVRWAAVPAHGPQQAACCWIGKAGTTCGTQQLAVRPCAWWEQPRFGFHFVLAALFLCRLRCCTAVWAAPIPRAPSPPQQTRSPAPTLRHFPNHLHTLLSARGAAQLLQTSQGWQEAACTRRHVGGLCSSLMGNTMRVLILYVAGEFPSRSGSRTAWEQGWVAVVLAGSSPSAHPVLPLPLLGAEQHAKSPSKYLRFNHT